jgi:hypothetical protein
MHRTVAASASSIGNGSYVVDYAHGGWTGVCQIERLRPLFSQADQATGGDCFYFFSAVWWFPVSPGYHAIYRWG